MHNLSIVNIFLAKTGVSIDVTRKGEMRAISEVPN